MALAVMTPPNKWTSGEVTKLIVQSGTLKRALTETAVAALMAKGSILSFSKGTLILQRGEQMPRFFVLLSGTARLAAHTMHGREFISMFLEPGNFWGVHPCLDEVGESHDALAQTDVQVLAVPAQNLRDLMWENREIQEALISLLCARLRMAVDVAEQFVTWTPRARLAWRVLAMAKSHGNEAIETGQTDIPVSQEALASMINLSRQRTNILLKEMQAEGLLSVEYGRLRVLDLHGLQALLEDPTTR